MATVTYSKIMDIDGGSVGKSVQARFEAFDNSPANRYWRASPREDGRARYATIAAATTVAYT